MGALFRLGRHAEAELQFRRATEVRPDFTAAYNNLGSSLKAQGKFHDAVVVYRHALALQPKFPDAYNNLGLTLWELGDHEAAIDSYSCAADLEPQNADRRNTLAVVLQLANRIDEAIAAYDEAIRIQPDHQETHFNRSLAYLARGDFERGWPDYEWRLKNESLRRPFRQPMWDGSPLEGKTILLHIEQGLGDTLQFIRYVPLVQARGGKVLVGIQKVLSALLTQSGFGDLIVRGKKLPEFDVHAPLLSLPAILRTTLENVPADVPYLAANPRFVERWREGLAGINGFKIGINWQGKPQLHLRQIPVRAVAGIRTAGRRAGRAVDQPPTKRRPGSASGGPRPVRDHRPGARSGPASRCLHGHGGRDEEPGPGGDF